MLPFQIEQGVPLCNIALQTSRDPAHKIEMLATFKPDFDSTCASALLSQFQSVKVVPLDIPTTDVETAPTTGKEQIICEYDCTLGLIALGGGVFLLFTSVLLSAP